MAERQMRLIGNKRRVIADDLETPHAGGRITLTTRIFVGLYQKVNILFS